MLTRTQITLFLGLAVTIWGASLWVLGVPITIEDAKPFALTVSGLSIACIIFDRWLWRSSIFRGWLVRRPDLQGTWKVLLQSNWIDPDTRQPTAPIHCVITIRQTSSALSLRLFTKESSSILVASNLLSEDDGVFQLTGVYRNTPGILLRGQKSEIHYGALLLEIRGNPPTELDGHYWTDRNTKGSLRLYDRKEKLVSSYSAGAKLHRFQE